MAFGKFGKIIRLRRGRGFPAARAPPAIARSADGRDRVRCRSSAARGSERCSEEVSPRLELGEFSAKTGEIPRQTGASRPAAGCRAAAPVRALRSASLNAPGAPPSRHSGCFSSASNVGGSSCFGDRFRGEPRENSGRACPSARRRRNRRRRDSSGQALPSRAAPARDPASPAPPICPDAAPRASRPRSPAPPSRDCRLRSRRDLSCRARSSRRSPARPAADAIARSRSKAASPRRPAHRVHVRAGAPRISTSPRLMPKRCSSACIANCGWFDAGWRGELALRVADAADQLPGLVVEIGIEPRQHHRALRQVGDGVQEFRRRRHRAGRAGRDHRTVMMRGQPRGFRLDQEIAPRRRLDLADVPRGCAGQACRAMLEELQRVLPVFVELHPAPARRARPSRPRG